MSLEQRPAWHFDYSPLPIGGGFAGEADRDLVVATADDVDPARVLELVGAGIGDLAVTSLFSSYPIFWTRLESSSSIDPEAVVRALSAGGIAVRYVTSARRGSQRLPAPLDFTDARPRAPNDWSARRPGELSEQETPWRWFVRTEGVDANRSICGTGAGTRLAVIDNDGRELERVGLDAEVLVGVDGVPRAQAHAAMLIGWAIGAVREDGAPFYGVAPDASPRMYCIPKPQDDVWSLPLAILRAANDGADVIVCATYVEGLTSPLLDDALEFATRLGRRGLGTAVVMPTGREMSSPEGSTHSSLSLALSDPASDPRVFCVGPSARDGAWFLWRDRRGLLRPFANRGPSIRWLAPGDDMAYPFAVSDRPAHAESSGASAVAGGVMLLLFARHPELTLRELEALLTLGSVPVDPARQSLEPTLADRRDLEPRAVDRDQHNAKHGYGRISARNACLAAADPVAQALVRVGEPDLAARYYEERRTWHPSLVSAGLCRWAASVQLADAGLAHAVASVVRALRLSLLDGPSPTAAQPLGTWIRQLALVLRRLSALDPPAPHAEELAALDARLRGLSFAAMQQLEAELLALARRVLVPEPGTPSRIVELRDPRARPAVLGAAKSPSGRR